jgi:PBP1b-binding outer membrane lipoprotein LpoB
MKKLIFLILFIPIIFISGCSTNTDNTDKTERGKENTSNSTEKRPIFSMPKYTIRQADVSAGTDSYTEENGCVKFTEPCDFNSNPCNIKVCGAYVIEENK